MHTAVSWLESGASSRSSGVRSAAPAPLPPSLARPAQPPPPPSPTSSSLPPPPPPPSSNASSRDSLSAVRERARRYRQQQQQQTPTELARGNPSPSAVGMLVPPLVIEAQGSAAMQDGSGAEVGVRAGAEAGAEDRARESLELVRDRARRYRELNEKEEAAAAEEETGLPQPVKSVDIPPNPGPSAAPAVSGAIHSVLLDDRIARLERSAREDREARIKLEVPKALCDRVSPLPTRGVVLAGSLLPLAGPLW
jgi:hypothetical protein